MDDLPAPLARDLVSVDHDSLDLEIEPVFDPFPGWLGWLPCLCVLPLTLLIAWLSLSEPEASGTLPALLVLQGLTVALGMYTTQAARPPLHLSFGMYRLELRSGPRTESIALPDLQKVTVTSVSLSFQLRDGREIRVPLPERSKATGKALDTLLQRALERGRTATGKVPAELEQLVGAQQGKNERDRAERS